MAVCVGLVLQSELGTLRGSPVDEMQFQLSPPTVGSIRFLSDGRATLFRHERAFGPYDRGMSRVVFMCGQAGAGNRRSLGNWKLME